MEYRPWDIKENDSFLKSLIELSRVVNRRKRVGEERWKMWKELNWTLVAQRHAPSRSADKARAKFYHYVMLGIGNRFGMSRESIEKAGVHLFGNPSAAEATATADDIPQAEQQGEQWLEEEWQVVGENSNGNPQQAPDEEGEDAIDADTALQETPRKETIAASATSPSSRPIRLFDSPEKTPRAVPKKKAAPCGPSRDATVDSSSKPVNEYERQRLDHIQKNREAMKRLGVGAEGARVGVGEGGLNPELITPCKKLKTDGEKSIENKPVVDANANASTSKPSKKYTDFFYRVVQPNVVSEKKQKKFFFKDEAGSEILAVIAIDMNNSSHYQYRTASNFKPFRIFCTRKEVFSWAANEMIESGCKETELPQELRKVREEEIWAQDDEDSDKTSTRRPMHPDDNKEVALWVPCCGTQVPFHLGKCRICSKPFTATEDEIRGSHKMQDWIQCTKCEKWWALSKKQSEEIKRLKLDEKGIEETCVTMGLRKNGCKTKKEREEKRQKANSPLKPKGKNKVHRQKQIIERKDSGGAIDTKMVRLARRAIRNRIQMEKREDFDVRATQGKFIGYIPGRDELIWPNSEVTDYEGRTKMIYMEIQAEHKGIFTENAGKYLDTFIALYRQKRLPVNRDGRQSAGPLDVTKFSVNDQLSAKQYHPNKSINTLLNFGNLFHIHQDGRKAFIGDLSDPKALKSASFMKGWKSCDIASWSGGSKLCGVSRKIVKNQLSKIQEIKDSEHFLSLAVKALWKQFSVMLPQAAEFQMQYKQKFQDMGDVKEDIFDGTGWNAYSINVSYRTACHKDIKNVDGSYSALCIFTAGERFNGGFYMVPEYRKAIDLRDGQVLFHTSNQDLHGNSEMHFEDPFSLRVALVFYLTKMATGQKLVQKPEKSGEDSVRISAQVEHQQQVIAELESKLQAEKERADNSEAAGSALQERLDDLEDTGNNTTIPKGALGGLEMPWATFEQEEDGGDQGEAVVVDLTADELPLEQKRKRGPTRIMIAGEGFYKGYKNLFVFKNSAEVRAKRKGRQKKRRRRRKKRE